MWIITPIGFFSAVEKQADRKRGTLTIRARAISDLEALQKRYFPDEQITKGGGSDYPCRIIVPREQFAEAVADMARMIDYGNFKDEVKRKQGQKRASIYGRLWGVLLDVSGRAERRFGIGGYSYGYGSRWPRQLPLPREREVSDDTEPCEECDGTGEDGRGSLCLTCGGTGIGW